MDNQAYLDQISPVTKKTFLNNNFFKSKITKIILGGIIVFFAIMILSSILSGGESEETKCIKLQLHTQNLSTAIDNFQPSVKSSKLRSESTSLKTILKNIEVTNEKYLKEKYNFKKGSIDKKLEETEHNLYAELNNDLFSAKINGFLDRTYARKMAYESALLRSYIEKIYPKNNNAEYKAELESFMKSLTLLEETFDSFSETNPNEFKVTKSDDKTNEDEE